MGHLAPMLRIKDITFAIEGRYLFQNASVTIPTGHKVGIVGRNGTGKTTLFNLITNKLVLEGGEISVPKGSRVGGISQEVPSSQTSLLDTVLEADVERTSLLAEAETATDPNRIGDIHARLSDIDAYSAEARASAILSGLGFDRAAQQLPCADFSGGWRMRVALAGILFAAPDVLLLDEPTNYLDLEGTIWLETYLARYPHTVLVISHDRQLLNRSVGSILHLDQQQLTLYTGGYDLFDSMRAERLAQQDAQRRKQVAQRDHLQAFVDRFRYSAAKAKQAQSRLKMISRLQPIADDRSSSVTAFNFPSPEELAPPIVKLEDVSVGYGGPPILKNLELRIDQDDRIALLGANGQGKSTLSKLLAGKLKPMQGRMVASNKLRIGYFAQHQVDELELDETPLEHLRTQRPKETPARLRARLAGGGLGVDQADTIVRKLSGGQKARLSLLLATLEAPHILILDEPTNHLDIESREALVMALTEYSGAVILVSHDAHLISLTADRLWLVKDGNVKVYNEDMDAYRKMLLAERGAGGAAQAKEKAAKKKAAKPKLSDTEKRNLLKPLKAEVAKCEDRIAKLEAMRGKLDKRLADPELYDVENKGKLLPLQRKHAELMTALGRSEEMWEQAETRLERAKKR